MCVRADVVMDDLPEDVSAGRGKSYIKITTNDNAWTPEWEQSGESGGKEVSLVCIRSVDIGHCKKIIV